MLDGRSSTGDQLGIGGIGHDGDGQLAGHREHRCLVVDRDGVFPGESSEELACWIVQIDAYVGARSFVGETRVTDHFGARTDLHASSFALAGRRARDADHGAITLAIGAQHRTILRGLREIGERDPQRDIAAFTEPGPVGVAVGEIAQEHHTAIDLRKTVNERACELESTVESVARCEEESDDTTARAAPRSVVGARAIRGGEPASTIPIASPSRAPEASSLAAFTARSQRVVEPALASMLSESSSTMTIAIEAPPWRPMASDEQCTDGVAPRRASATTAAVRTA